MFYGYKGRDRVDHIVMYCKRRLIRRSQNTEILSELSDLMNLEYILT